MKARNTMSDREKKLWEDFLANSPDGAEHDDEAWVNYLLMVSARGSKRITKKQQAYDDFMQDRGVQPSYTAYTDWCTDNKRPALSLAQYKRKK
jgi:hypothetical protein